MICVADNLWVLRHPLPIFGRKFGRTVTVIRLRSGRLLIHSTAPFTVGDVAAIRELGEPGWILDASRFHDTHAVEGRRAFPEVPYLAPPGFRKGPGTAPRPIMPAPAEWAGEVEVIPLAGMPQVREHVFCHLPSRTLIVCDLLFNFSSASGVTKFLVRHCLRLPELVGTSLFFRMMIRDRAAFAASVRDMLRWDFDRIVVGHGAIIETGGKEKLRRGLERLGWDLD